MTKESSAQSRVISHQSVRKREKRVLRQKSDNEVAHKIKEGQSARRGPLKKGTHRQPVAKQETREETFISTTTSHYCSIFVAFCHYHLRHNNNNELSSKASCIIFFRTVLLLLLFEWRCQETGQNYQQQQHTHNQLIITTIIIILDAFWLGRFSTRR